MNSDEIRENFLKFFEKKGHRVLPPSSLIPTDPSVLFTTAGMQQFKEYYLGNPPPYGNKVTTCQKCFRTSDIEEVGDEKHLTFLEMLGNFSFGDYFKEETIKFAQELLISNFQLPISEMTVTVFGGDKEIPLDKESEKIWNTLGFSKNKGNLQYKGRADNFWGPTGLEGPCGPTTEIHFRGIEVWNLVFNEYYQDREGKLTFLKQKGVDTGMGLERLAMIIQNKNSVFETDLFFPIIKEVPGENERAKRIIADHVKGSVFLISEGVLPSNLERGYALRRILRRAIRYGKLLNLPKNFLIPLAKKVIEIYKDVYPEVKLKETDILTVIQNEEEKFEKTLEYGLKILHTEIKARAYKPGKKISNIPDVTPIKGFPSFTPFQITSEWLFKFYQSFAIDPDLVFEEIERELHRKYTDSEKKKLMEDFHNLMKKHQEISRAGAEKKFGGGGQFSPKLHTATHLLHAALRKILGEHVKQMGSDINPQRLRFDFLHPKKMTKEELKRVEDLVNQKIKENLEVKKEEVSLKEALKSGALAFFKEKYPERVSVYSVGDFSKEICAGPHVKKTGELGYFKIEKEESAGAGVRRIKAVLK